MKELLKNIKGYWKETLLSPITVALEVVMEIIIPLVISDIINAVSFHEDPSATPTIYFLKYILNVKVMTGVMTGGLILIGCATLSLLFGYLSGKLAAKASAGFAKNLRQNIYYNVQNFSFANIDKFSTASLITRSTTDVTNVQQAFMMIIRTAIRAPFMLIFSMVMALNISKSLGLTFVYVVPLLAVVLTLIILFAFPNFRQMFKKYDELNTVVQENVGGARTVKAYVREEHETEKFKKTSKDVYHYSTRAEAILAFNNPAMMSAVYFCMIMISFLAASLIAKNSLSVGELNSLLTFVMQILMSLMMLSMILVMITMAKASVDRIVEVLKEKSTIIDGPDAIEEVKDGSIEFSHVNFSYSGDINKLVLEDINLKIASGQTVGIVGATGSAKSTLVNLIPRLYDVTTGTLKVGGVEVKDYNIKKLRDQVAVVLQKNVLFSGSISENLRWGNLNASEQEVVHASQLAQADEFVSKFNEGYDTYIEQGGSNVSGGQKQRLCIARALLKKPKILILDDSTSAVDTKTDALIRKAFVQEIPNTTKIIIAQRISSIQDCDLIVVLDDGKVVATGTHESLLKNCRIYLDVYTSQVKGAGSESLEGAK